MKILTVSLTLLHRPQEKTVLFLQMLRQLVSSGKKICQTEKICNSNAFLIEMCKYFSPNAFRMFSICLFQRFYLHKRYYTTKFIKYLINLSCFWRFPQFLQNHRSIRLTCHACPSWRHQQENNVGKGLNLAHIYMRAIVHLHLESNVRYNFLPNISP